jgi:hypothetical protein
MIAERLHSVVSVLLQEYKVLDLAKRFAALQARLNASVASPTPENAEIYKTALDEFESGLLTSATINFVPSQQRILSAIGGTDKVGTGLFHRIDALLNENQITPAHALAKMQGVYEEFVQFQATLERLSRSLVDLHVGTEDPSGETYELGILIPKELVENDLDGLNKELKRLDQHLRTFAEIVHADPKSLTIRSLGTGSLEFFLDSPAEVAAAVMIAVERLVALYKQILEIRTIRKGLEDKKFPPGTVKLVKDHEAQLITDELDTIRDEIITENYKSSDLARKNELKNALTSALKYIADRIDRGVDFEARPPAPPTVPQTSEEEGAERKPSEGPQQHAAIVSKSGSVMLGLQRSTTPVLQLLDQTTNDSTEPKKE